jgi:hypothetical protein
MLRYFAQPPAPERSRLEHDNGNQLDDKLMNLLTTDDVVVDPHDLFRKS